MPKLLREVHIPYPPSAKARGLEGSVVLNLLIDADGKVRDAQLVQGIAEDLNHAALQAVQKFQFKPAQVADQPVAVRIRYAYRFVLEH